MQELPPASKVEDRRKSTTDLTDPVRTAVIANGFEAVTRQMSNTLQRTGRSAALNVARDFSCAIVTNSGELLSSAEGLPSHIYGVQLQAQAVAGFHPNQSEGDAYLHNDPYTGNSHPADHAILVPVYVEEHHLFTAVAKAHLGDIGNSLPTTYMAGARDLYEEGALIFPAVQIQRNYADIDDIIRICRTRIRVPDQWYGDYLAMLGAARIGEGALKSLVQKYGMADVAEFIDEWFDYSERRMMTAIKCLPTGSVDAHGRHDPFPGMPQGLDLKAHIEVDAEEAIVTVDFRDNADNIDAGCNSSKACSMSAAMQGVFSVLDPTVPHNAGSFRRFNILLRGGCIAGEPEFPHSVSLATTDPFNRLVNIVASGLAALGAGHGLAEGGGAQGVGFSVIYGEDPRRGDASYINQLVLGNNGGPASPYCDGWLTYGVTVIAGLMYRDSVEIDEQKYPLLVRWLRLVRDSAGAGKFRGAPGVDICYGPTLGPMSVAFPCDGSQTPPRGVAGGTSGGRSSNLKIHSDGSEEVLPNVYLGMISPGEFVRGVGTGGGGYGSPLERDLESVRTDVRDGWVSVQRAGDVYGVLFHADSADGGPVVDVTGTTAQRKLLGGGIDT